MRRYKGHSAHVLSLYAHRESQKFISGGQDKRALMWDTRMSVPVQTFQSDANSIGRSISSKTQPRGVCGRSTQTLLAHIRKCLKILSSLEKFHTAFV